MNLAGIQASREDLLGDCCEGIYRAACNPNFCRHDATPFCFEPSTREVQRSFKTPTSSPRQILSTRSAGASRSVHGASGTAGGSSGLHPQRSQPRAGFHLHRPRPCTALVDLPLARSGENCPLVRLP